MGLGQCCEEDVGDSHEDIVASPGLKSVNAIRDNCSYSYLLVSYYFRIIIMSSICLQAAARVPMLISWTLKDPVINDWMEELLSFFGKILTYFTYTKRNKNTYTTTTTTTKIL